MFRSTVVLGLFFILQSIACFAQLSQEETEDFLRMVRVDLAVMFWSKEMRRELGLMAQGAPTRKSEPLYKSIYDAIDLQEVYSAAVIEIATGLDSADLEVLEPCLTSSGYRKYKTASYNAMTRQGELAFREERLALELGIESMDPAREKKIRDNFIHHSDREAQKAWSRSLMWLFAHKAQKIYPALARSKDQITKLLDRKYTAPASDSDVLNAVVFRYVLLKSLDDSEFDAFIACEETPEMDKYDALYLTGMTRYLETLSAE